MKTEHYISQLLYRYQCVTVPGFGAFLAEVQPAQLHENSNAFYPPKKVISFNSYLKNNDGLLANHIAQSEKINYEAAVEAIQEQVAIWKQLLHTEGRFALKHIGEVSLNPERNLVFLPSDHANYLTDSFGLSSVVSPAVKREVYKEEAVILEEKAPIAFTPERREANSYLKYAAIFVLALTAVGGVGFKYQQDQIAQQKLVVETAVQEKVQSKIQEATFFIQNPLPPVTLSVKEETFPYHIVAGAFRSEANAQMAYENLKKEGFNSRRIPQNKHGLYPVLFGSYATYAEAQKEMAEIQRSKNADAWLLVKDL
ncbi:MAG TPA: SPOR domain-containing protein [Flavobacterium sp.]|jgi:hypothetical protein